MTSLASTMYGACVYGGRMDRTLEDLRKFQENFKVRLPRAMCQGRSYDGSLIINYGAC